MLEEEDPFARPAYGVLLLVATLLPLPTVSLGPSSGSLPGWLLHFPPANTKLERQQKPWPQLRKKRPRFRFFFFPFSKSLQ